MPLQFTNYAFVKVVWQVQEHLLQFVVRMTLQAFSFVIPVGTEGKNVSFMLYVMISLADTNRGSQPFMSLNLILSKHNHTSKNLHSCYKGTPTCLLRCRLTYKDGRITYSHISANTDVSFITFTIKYLKIKYLDAVLVGLAILPVSLRYGSTSRLYFGQHAASFALRQPPSVQP